jgi:hypothetical protein
MKIGITFSVFDLLHAGHIKMLEEDKSQQPIEFKNKKINTTFLVPPLGARGLNQSYFG